MRPKKLKILHLLSQRPDSTGSGIYVQAMLREASARKHTNYLLAGIQAESMPNLECIQKDRFAFVRFSGRDISFPIVGMSDVMPYQSSRFCNLTDVELLEYENCFERKLKTIVKEFKPDIIHSHHLWLLSALARRIFPDLPIVTTCHGSDLRQFQACSHLQEKVVSGCQRLDAIMALSEAQKKDIERLYHVPLNKIYVVGAGYNHELFSPAVKPKPEPVQLIYAGKLSFAKGVPWFLRSLSKIDSPAWQLHLVGGGSGEEKEECLKLARNLGGRVAAHGTMQQQDLAKLMKQSHIFILPSFYEGLPLVVLEALACGCRIIATDLPGVTEIIKDIKTNDISLVKTPRLYSIDAPVPEDQIIFENDLENALREQIDATVKGPMVDLSKIEDQIALFSWPNVFERVQQVYFEAMNTFP